ncbi:MAG: EamA family transporter [Candidatus Omnitrophota bacterium]
MAYLLVASLIWGLSFGLIKIFLAGVDASAVAVARLSLSCLAFLPFLRPGALRGGLRWRLTLTGAVQYGLMYVFYLRSFKTLLSYEVALFTALTPFYVALLDGWVRRRLCGRVFAASALAVIGTWIAVWQNPLHSRALGGFLLVQASNICFALGQIAYRQILQKEPGLPDHRIFALLYLGGVLASAVMLPGRFGLWPEGLSLPQTGVLIYLGLVASGLGFFLWNAGARRVGPGTLAILNNFKIPLAAIFAVLLFGEKAYWARLTIGLAIVFAALSLVREQRDQTAKS